MRIADNRPANPAAASPYLRARNYFLYLFVFVSLMGKAFPAENDACLSRATLIGVAGPNGEPSKALTAGDFRVTVGGKAASVESAKPADGSPRVVILLDASANHDQSTWATTQALVEEFLAGFSQVGDFTLLTFDDKVQQMVHETSGAALQGTVGEMFPSGKRESEAGLADAVKQGSASFGAYRQGDSEVVITTSDQIQKETEQALSQQRAAGIRIVGISFDQSRRRGPTSFGPGMTVENYSPLEAAAKASGGLRIRFDMSQEDLAASLRRAREAGKEAGMLVRNYVTLDLRLTKPLTKPEKLKIELIKGARIDPKDSATAYPQELFPCQ